MYLFLLLAIIILCAIVATYLHISRRMTGGSGSDEPAEPNADTVLSMNVPPFLPHKQPIEDKINSIMQRVPVQKEKTPASTMDKLTAVLTTTAATMRAPETQTTKEVRQLPQPTEAARQTTEAERQTTVQKSSRFQKSRGFQTTEKQSPLTEQAQQQEEQADLPFIMEYKKRVVQGPREFVQINESSGKGTLHNEHWRYTLSKDDVINVSNIVVITIKHVDNSASTVWVGRLLSGDYNISDIMATVFSVTMNKDSKQDVSVWDPKDYSDRDLRAYSDSLSSGLKINGVLCVPLKKFTGIDSKNTRLSVSGTVFVRVNNVQVKLKSRTSGLSASLDAVGKALGVTGNSLKVYGDDEPITLVRKWLEKKQQQQQQEEEEAAPEFWTTLVISANNKVEIA